MTLTIDDPEIIKAVKLIPEIMQIVTSIQNQDLELTSKYYDLETCFKLRGAGSWNTFKCKRYYQPKGGIPDTMVQGRKVWEKETVKEWLMQTDETLPEYHKKYKTGAKKC